MSAANCACVAWLVCFAACSPQAGECNQPGSVSAADRSTKATNEIPVVVQPQDHRVDHVRKVAIAGREVQFIRVEPGEFVMLDGGKYIPDGPAWNLRGALSGGSYGGGAHNQGPPRRTSISRAYWIAIEPITWDQYLRFMRTLERPEAYVLPDGIPGDMAAAAAIRKARGDADDGKPAVLDTSASAQPLPWVGAAGFIRWASEDAGVPMRLPTEAEWEHFARQWDRLDKGGVQIVEGTGPSDSVVGEWTSDRYSRLIDPRDTVDPAGPAVGEHGTVRRTVVERHLGADRRRPFGGDGWGGRIRPVLKDPSASSTPRAIE